MKIFRTSDYVLIVSWIAAFILSMPLIHPAALARLGAILCIAVFGLTGLGRELAGPGVRAGKSLVFWTVPCLWLLALASVAWSAAPFASFIDFSTLSLFALGFAVFACGRGIFRPLMPLAPIVALVLFVLALWAIIQYLFLPSMLLNGQVRSPFANPGHYASLLMLALLPAVGLMMSASNARVRLSALALAAVLAASIVIIGGSAVIGLSLLGLLALAYACRTRLKKNGGDLGVLVAAGVVAFAVRLVFFLVRGGAGASRAGDLFATDAPEIHARIALWKSTLAIIRDHWLLGTGYGTFYLFYPQYRRIGDTASAGIMAHNDLLQLWAEMGILAPLLMLTLFLGGAWRMKKVMDVRGPESGERAVCLGLFLGAALVGLDGLINFDLYTGSILCLLGLVLGMWYRYSGLALGEKGVDLSLPPTVPRRLGWVVVGIPLALMVFMAQGFLRSEYHAGRAEHALMSEDWGNFQRGVDASRRSGFDRNARPYVLAASIPVGVLEAQGKNLSSPARAEVLQRADFLLSNAEARSPRLAVIYYDRAVIAEDGMDKGLGNARDWLRQALILDPGHIPSRMLLADIDNREGKAGEAVDVLAAGLNRAPVMVNPDGYYSMTASLALKQGRVDVQDRALRRLRAWRVDHPVPDPAAIPDRDIGPVPLF